MIALFIIFISYKIFKKSNNRLLGEPIPQGLINKIKKLVPREKVIYGAHDISLHSYGDIKILTLHLEIEKSINLFKAHALSEEIREVLMKKFMFADVVIHIDPVNYSDPEVTKIKEFLEDYVQGSKEWNNIHDLRIIGEKEWRTVVFDLIPQGNIPKKIIIKNKNALYPLLKNKFPKYKKFVITIDPKFNY